MAERQRRESILDISASPLCVAVGSQLPWWSRGPWPLSPHLVMKLPGVDSALLGHCRVRCRVCKYLSQEGNDIQRCRKSERSWQRQSSSLWGRQGPGKVEFPYSQNWLQPPSAREGRRRYAAWLLHLVGSSRVEVYSPSLLGLLPSFLTESTWPLPLAFPSGPCCHPLRLCWSSDETCIR